jgi:hypothetical protein
MRAVKTNRDRRSIRMLQIESEYFPVNNKNYEGVMIYMDLIFKLLAYFIIIISCWWHIYEEEYLHYFFLNGYVNIKWRNLELWHLIATIQVIAPDKLSFYFYFILHLLLILLIFVGVTDFSQQNKYTIWHLCCF